MCPLPTCAAVNASHRRYSGAPLRVILEGFQSLLVSMQVVGYHEWEIGFLGTSTRRRVGSFISHPTGVQE